MGFIEEKREVEMVDLGINIVLITKAESESMFSMCV